MEVESARAAFQFRPIEGLDAEAQLARLLDGSFPVPSGRHFADDFPVWFSRECFRLGAFRAGALVASAGLRVADLKTPGGPLRVGIVGAVATDAGDRGQGLATALVGLLGKGAADNGVAALFLWGAEHSMYRRLGYELCGHEVRVPLAALDLPAADPAAAGMGWNPGIFDRMSAREEGLVLRPSDRAWVGAHRNVEWAWLGDSTSPRAYAAFGRGIDLTGLVHEWGGEPAAIRELLGALRARHPEAALLGRPDLLARAGLGLAPGASAPEGEFLCMARVLDPAKVVGSFHPGSGVTFARAAGLWTVECADGRWDGLADADLVSLLFGRMEGLPPALSSRFPLPLWFWGLDSA